MRRYCETCKDIVQDGPEPHVCICKHSHLASQCPFCKIEKERDALRARVAELEGLLRRARSVIPNEYEDEIAVRTAINTYLNAHQGLGPGASYEPI